MVFILVKLHCKEPNVNALMLKVKTLQIFKGRATAAQSLFEFSTSLFCVHFLNDRNNPILFNSSEQVCHQALR